MSALLSAILPALLPAAADGLRGIFSRITGGKGALPQNIGEVVQIMNAETDRMRALAQLDTPTGELYKWVSSFRALQRPALSTLIILGYMIAVFASDASQETLDMLGSYAQMVTFYLFGDRAYNYIKKGR